jgi:hypothetical protein
MDLFVELFGSMLAFVYHCFDRIVIHGYLSSLSRPDQVVYFFRQVVGVPVVSKEVLSRRTADDQSWVEAFARNHKTPIEWAEKGVRKEDHVRPHLRRMTQQESYGVYFIFKSLEQGSTFRISVPKYATKDPNHRILAPQRSRFTHYYFYIRDEVLGPMVMRVASFFPFRTSYYLNGHSFIEQELKRAQIGFRKTDNAFLDVDNVAALQAAADKCGGAAGCRRQAEPGDHPQAARLLDPDPRAEILRQGTRADEAVTLLCHQSDRVLSQFHLQAELSHPQALRAQLRDRPVAAHRHQDRRDLRHAPQSQDEGQARHRHRADRAWPSCLPCLFQEQLPQAV